jgi:tetratricopeptide (TPR) repeat protein
MQNEPVNISLEEYSELEDYLDGNLSGAVLSAFETRLNEEPLWSEKLSQVRILREGIARAAMKSQLAIFHQEMIPKKSQQRFLNARWIWTVAASLFIAITAGVGFWSGWFDSSSEQLFSAYYAKDPGLTSMMSDAGDYEFDRGMVEYKSGEYAKSLEFWKPLLDLSPQNDTLLYFVAMDYLQLETLEESKLLLEQVIQDDSSQFAQDANWYLGLLKVREGSYQEAISYLNASERDEAAALISKLQELEE